LSLPSETVDSGTLLFQESNSITNSSSFVVQDSASVTLKAATSALSLGFTREPAGPGESPQTSIVQQVKNAGVKEADLSKTDVAGLQVWLMQHGDVAKNIAPQ
jgi:hypothetical protein